MQPPSEKAAAPIRPKERFIILDSLRGLALLGICLANFPEFSLYTFLHDNVTAAMPAAGIDRIVKYLQYILIDGKFYTMFSLLFGMGFSIILSNTMRTSANGLRVFYRRMALLLIIGALHLMLLWSGDILMLYALLGFLLPLFRRVSDRGLLLTSATLILLPIALDALKTLYHLEPSAPAIRLQQYFCTKYGITTDNFAYWLKKADNYPDVLRFLVQGAFVRIQEFIDGNRPFKVMGLFLLGFYLGRNRLYAQPEEHKTLLRQISLYGAVTGLPASALYALSALNGHPWGLVAHSALYALGVFPLGLAYMSAACLWYLRHKENALFKILAAPGRMALTNYIGQSLCGMLLFYGTGFGLGARLGLASVTMIALAVYLAETLFSLIWLRFCRFGPLEWLWRMLTYRKKLPLLK